jgi:dihydroorotate dehydrogenase electron transfer subunit
LNAIEARRLASVCRTTTEDGTSGDRGRVTDILVETMEKCETEVVYSCGPHPMLAAVSRICVDNKVPIQVAVEELMGCGYGVCMTCVMPLRRPARKTAKAPDPEEDSVYYARSCTEGPVFNGASVVWNGSADAVATDQSELTPAGAASRGTAALATEDEHAPPGN